MNISPRSLALPLLAAVLLGPALCAQPAPASSPSDTTPNTPPSLYLGAAWYPEQWPESRWDADLTLMEAPTSASSASESSPGAASSPPTATTTSTGSTAPSPPPRRHRIYVVIGTPSAAPPAWLTTKYPETLRTMEDGRKDQHGNRQQFNWADPKYRELSRAMAEQDRQALRP